MMSLSLGLGLTSVRGGGGGFNPASLFANGEEGALYLPGPNTCFTDTAGTTAAGVGDPVARINDSSGNGNNATQATTAARPTLQQTAGGLWYLSRDPTDDGIDIPMQLNGSRWSAGMAYVPDEEAWILVSNTDDGPPWAGIGGGTGDLAGPGASQNAIYFDNTLSTETTRAGQYTLSQAANTVLVDFNVSADWDSVRIGKHTATYNTPGDIYGFVLIDRELTAQERSTLQSFFEGRLP